MGKRIQKKKDLRAYVLFLLRLNLLLIPFYAIIYLDISFYSLQEGFAEFLAVILNFLGVPAVAENILLYVNNFPIDISRDCIGWKSGYSLFALVFASKGYWKDKIVFLAKWIPFLLLLNVFRIISTILIGVWFGYELIEIVHTYVWQFIVLGMVVGLWVYWVKREGMTDARQ